MAGLIVLGLQRLPQDLCHGISAGTWVQVMEVGVSIILMVGVEECGEAVLSRTEACSLAYECTFYTEPWQ